MKMKKRKKEKPAKPRALRAPLSPKKPLSILLTGVPGIGKTSLALAWCEQSDWAYLSLNDLVKTEGLYTGVDERDGAKVVELGKLEAAANEWLAAVHSPAIIEGHLGCDIRLKVDRVLVLRLHPDEVELRLRARLYNAYQLEENKMAELLDYCTIHSIKHYGSRRVYELDLTGCSLQQSVSALRQFAASAKPPAEFRPHVSWSDALLAHIAQNVKKE